MQPVLALCKIVILSRFARCPSRQPNKYITTFRWDFMAPGGIDFIKRGGPYDDNEYMAALKSNISLVKDHPAVLGY